MAEVAYYDADLSDALEKVNEAMSKMAKAPAGIKMELLAMAEKKMKEAIELKKGYQLAMRQANREEARVYRERFQTHCDRIEQLNGELKWAKSDKEREGLFGDRSSSFRGEAAGNREMLDKSMEIQKKTEQSLMSTQKMVEASKEVAMATGEQLREQRNQIVQITDEVMRMEDNLMRADKLIRTFARRMATDRVIMLFALLSFLGIAAIVVYKSMYPNDKTFSVPDEVLPPSPDTIYNAAVSAANNTFH